MTRSWTQNPSGIYVETFTPSPPSPLAELDAPFGNFATIDAILGRLNGTIVVQHASGSPTVYQPSANTDAARGAALLAALAAAVSGDMIYLAALTYDCQASQITVPSGVILQGADKLATVIHTSWKFGSGSGSASHPSIAFGNGCVTNNLTLDMRNADAIYRAIGASGNNCSITLTNVAMLGGSDCICDHATGTTWSCTGCSFRSAYDTFNVLSAGGGVVANCCNCDFHAVYNYSGQNFGTSSCRCFLISQGENTTLSAYNCTFESAPNTTAEFNNFTITNAGSDPTSVINLFNPIVTSDPVDASTNFDVDNSNGATVNVLGGCSTLNANGNLNINGSVNFLANGG